MEKDPFKEYLRESELFKACLLPFLTRQQGIY